jgi:hypothetical protein
MHFHKETLLARGDEKFLLKISCLSRVGEFLFARTATYDPFVYRLGLQVFILARRVRLPYGSPFFIIASALAEVF